MQVLGTRSSVELVRSSVLMRRPAEFYKRSGRKYPDTFQSRRVNGSGRIWVENQSLYLSNSLAYQQVGLKPLPALELEIHLAGFCLARMELETRKIIWARPNDLVQLPLTSVTYVMKLKRYQCPDCTIRSGAADRGRSIK